MYDSRKVAGQHLVMRKEQAMAGDQEKAALRAHIVTLETRVQETEGGAARKEHAYIVKT